MINWKIVLLGIFGVITIRVSLKAINKLNVKYQIIWIYFPNQLKKKKTNCNYFCGLDREPETEALLVDSIFSLEDHPFFQLMKKHVTTIKDFVFFFFKNPSLIWRYKAMKRPVFRAEFSACQKKNANQLLETLIYFY